VRRCDQLHRQDLHHVDSAKGDEAGEKLRKPAPAHIYGRRSYDRNDSGKNSFKSGTQERVLLSVRSGWLGFRSEFALQL